MLSYRQEEHIKAWAEKDDEKWEQQDNTISRLQRYHGPHDIKDIKGLHLVPELKCRNHIQAYADYNTERACQGISDDCSNMNNSPEHKQYCMTNSCGGRCAEYDVRLLSTEQQNAQAGEVPLFSAASYSVAGTSSGAAVNGGAQTRDEAIESITYEITHELDKIKNQLEILKGL